MRKIPLFLLGCGAFLTVTAIAYFGSQQTNKKFWIIGGGLLTFFGGSAQVVQIIRDRQQIKTTVN